MLYFLSAFCFSKHFLSDNIIKPVFHDKKHRMSNSSWHRVQQSAGLSRCVFKSWSSLLLIWQAILMLNAVHSTFPTDGHSSLKGRKANNKQHVSGTITSCTSAVWITTPKTRAITESFVKSLDIKWDSL